MSKEKLSLTDALLCAGSHVGTQNYRDILATWQKEAADANRIIQDIEPESVYHYGASETLYKLKRNAAALSTLLSMCADCAGYMKEEIYGIFKAQENYDKEQERKHGIALERELESKRIREKNQKQRSKPQAEAE